MQLQFRYHFILFLTGLTLSASAQVPDGGGMYVNEINQGGSGVKEFVEFVVLGDPDNPCAAVNLTGWVFDDNNGSFESCGTGVGIATGHYRFTSCYSSVLPGSIFVIYNAADVYTGMPSADPTDANGDLVYVIPSNSSCLEANYSIPVSSPANCTYGGSYVAPTLTWAAGMSNSGDVSQIRKPDYSFFHGFSYGDVTTTFPSWPTGAGGGTSFNKGTGNLALDCGSVWSSASFVTTTAGAGTPGAANTINNGYFISNIQNCVLNYSDLNDVDNCALILDLEENEIAGYASSHGNVIEWVDENHTFSSVELWRSTDEGQFLLIDLANTAELENAPGSFSIIDKNPVTGTQYYFVRWANAEAQNIITSNTISIRPGTHTPNVIQITPNPASTEILIRLQEYPLIHSVTLYNAAGSPVLSTMVEGLSSYRLDITSLPSGIYFIEGQSNTEVFTGRFVKM